MKLRTELNGEQCELTLELRDSRVTADICGRKYLLDVRQLGDDAFLLFEGGRVFEFHVNPHHASKTLFDVAIRGKNHLVTVIDPRRLRTDEDSARDHHGKAEIAAPMPGKVVRVLVEAGQDVEVGSGLVVVEAMKMQNEMRSPRAGVVVSINVSAGDTVEAGTLLVVIE
ncbi:MAG TPA: acetyl-CoA carboxylase biotin carboxyl carrier protein subunit [Pyrinomonadaceae bacterium]|nr:acetyl-CoA carboxylase biotin carboxyl carrier protein subunit [Pyrinomonadaceae bacterium]